MDLTSLLKFLHGKKTYIIAFILAVIYFLKQIGIEIPNDLETLLASMGLVAARFGAVKRG